jgi:hypothetical protein
MIIFSIYYLLFYNSIPLISAFILPISIDKISYFKEIESKLFTIDSNWKSKNFYLFNSDEISDFLKNLDVDDNYIATIEFIPNLSEYNSDSPQLILSKPFLINRLSSSTTLSVFIMERLNYMVDYYYLDDSIIQKLDGIGPIVKINYSKIHFIYPFLR